MSCVIKMRQASQISMAFTELFRLKILMVGEREYYEIHRTYRKFDQFMTP